MRIRSLALLAALGCQRPQPAQPPAVAAAYLDSCRQQLATTRKERDRLLAAGPSRTVDNTLVPLNDAQIALTNAQTRARVYMLAHPDPALRAAADICGREADALDAELALSRPIYEAIRSVDTSHADADTRRFRELVLRDAVAQGVDRDDATRARLRELGDRQQVLARAFERAIQDDAATVRIPAAALRALPDDYRRAHPAGADGQVTIPMQRPHVVPILELSDDSKARRAIFHGWTNLGWPQNDRTLKEFLTVVHERATLLGSRTGADGWLARNMLRDPAAVRRFLNRYTKALGQKSDPIAQLLAQKRLTHPAAERVELWESLYLIHELMRAETRFDSAELRPYFELNRTVAGVLALTTRLYGLEYRRVQSAEAWHADVQSYDVLEHGQLVARLHLDLHPRAGKETIFSAHALQAGVAGRQLAEATLLGNFPDARGSGAPTLLDQIEVSTLLHELGHVMHQIFSARQRWIRLHGYNVEEVDFMEGPARMLEQFAWEPEALRTFAVHVDGGAPIPDELMQRMRAANELRQRMQGRMLGLAWLGLEMFSSDHPATLDLPALGTRLMVTQVGLGMSEGAHDFASASVLVTYGPNLYTYLWNLVTARAIMDEFHRTSVLDPAVALRFRKAVLDPGASRSADDLLRDFLGHDFRYEDTLATF